MLYMIVSISAIFLLLLMIVVVLLVLRNNKLKKAHEEMDILRQEAEAASKSKSNFLQT